MHSRDCQPFFAFVTHCFCSLKKQKIPNRYRKEKHGLSMSPNLVIGLGCFDSLGASGLWFACPTKPVKE
jgi:hypothetical protein